MELWIRTQSRQSLVKVDNVSITEQTKTRYNVDSGEWILGRYNSFERALEILDEIQNILKPKILLRRNDDNDKELLGALQKGVTSKIDIDFKELPTYVYEMPKE